MNPDELFKAPTCSGIYYFRNKLNGKYYVGQAEHLRKRLRHHVSNFKCNRYDNPIYRALKKYGWENFDWGILEEFKDEPMEIIKNKLDEAEERYIKQFNSYGATGYNQTYGGDGGIKGYKFTEEQIKHQKEIAKNKNKVLTGCEIFFYDLETKEYGTQISWSEFRKIHNIKSNHLNVLVHSNRFIVGRTKEDVEEKLNRYNSEKRTGTTKHNKHVINKVQLDDCMIEDIKNGMKWEEYCNKYSVCRKTFFVHKNIVLPGKKREYKTIIDLAIYELYRKNHTREETQKHFNISRDLTFRYDKRIREHGNVIATIDSTSSSITEEMKKDLLNGISIKEYREKYNVSESLYSIHRRIVDELNK